MTTPSAGTVVKVDGSYKYDTGKHYAEVTCHHRSSGACGGCYARLFLILEVIAADPSHAAEHVARVFAEMKRDGS